MDKVMDPKEMAITEEVVVVVVAVVVDVVAVVVVVEMVVQVVVQWENAVCVVMRMQSCVTIAWSVMRLRTGDRIALRKTTQTGRL